MTPLIAALEQAIAQCLSLDLSIPSDREASLSMLARLQQCDDVPGGIKEDLSAWHQKISAVPLAAETTADALMGVLEKALNAAKGVSTDGAQDVLPIDDESMAIYRTEAAENISTAEQGLLELEKNPKDSQTLQRILRAVHTIKGGASIVAQTVLAGFAHDLETFLIQMTDACLPCQGEDATLLLRSIDAMKTLIHNEQKGQGNASEDAGLQALHHRLKDGPGKPAAAAATPAAAAPTADALPANADKDLINDFLVEAGEYIQKSEEALLTLEKNPKDNESVNVVFRAFHTIKGVSSSLDLTLLQQLAHHAESLMSLVRDGKIQYSGVCTDLSLRAIDMLKAVMASVKTALKSGQLFRPAGYTEFLQLLETTTFALMKGESVALPGREAVPEPQSATANAPAAAAPSAGGEASNGDGSIRVRIDRLDRLMDMVGELVISHSLVAQDEFVVKPVNLFLQKKVAQTGKIVREMQSLSMTMRMVPLKPTFQKMARLVRDVSQKSGKPIQFVTSGEDTEIDRTMVDLIGDPLVHMLRNAIDHGIESPDQRTAAGKAPKGQIQLTAFHAGGQVIVELRDDGKGLDRDKILSKAIEKGLISKGHTLTDSEIYNLIFEPGFSTADKVTDLSGRGVGMDVVRRNIESLRGRIDIRTEKGKGTTFVISLPLTLAITDGMLVQAGQQRYIIPTQNIRVCFRPNPEDLTTVLGSGEVVLWRKEPIILRRLKDLFDIPDAVNDPTQGLVVVLGDGSSRMALLVDRLLGQHHVVAKSLQRIMGHVPGISGAAILGDGQVGLILDMDALSVLAQRARHAVLPEVEHAA